MDSGDLAQERDEGFRAAALAAKGLASRVTEVPPPYYAGQPARCSDCAGKPEIGALCGPCNTKPATGE